MLPALCRRVLWNTLRIQDPKPPHEKFLFPLRHFLFQEQFFTLRASPSPPSKIQNSGSTSVFQFFQKLRWLSLLLVWMREACVAGQEPKWTTVSFYTEAAAHISMFWLSKAWHSVLWFLNRIMAWTFLEWIWLYLLIGFVKNALTFGLC